MLNDRLARYAGVPVDRGLSMPAADICRDDEFQRLIHSLDRRRFVPELLTVLDQMHQGRAEWQRAFALLCLPMMVEG